MPLFPLGKKNTHTLVCKQIGQIISPNYEPIRRRDLSAPRERERERDNGATSKTLEWWYSTFVTTGVHVIYTAMTGAQSDVHLLSGGWGRADVEALARVLPGRGPASLSLIKQTPHVEGIA